MKDISGGQDRDKLWQSSHWVCEVVTMIFWLLIQITGQLYQKVNESINTSNYYENTIILIFKLKALETYMSTIPIDQQLILKIIQQFSITTPNE